MKIAVDAMGSDAHPEPDVGGAVMAARQFGDEIILVGPTDIIEAELQKHDWQGLRISIEHASQVIEMTDRPSEVIRTKKDSSMHIGTGLVRDGLADAFVSAGNTGGILAVATLQTLRRIEGVLRPALGVIFPTQERPMLIDHGANADCKPEYLLQFGIMGSLYVERVLGLKEPRVALLSSGEEEGKGNKLIKDSIPLFQDSKLNYVGNIEPKEFMQGYANVAVTDGFTGNLVMKMAEAVASYLGSSISAELKSGIISSIGGLLAKPALKRVAKQLDPHEVGGAPLLGLNGIVIVGHGRSNAFAIKQAIGQARTSVDQDIIGAIEAGIGP